MNAQTQLFCTMLMAMCDEELWPLQPNERVSVENAVDASPEEFQWEDAHFEETEEYRDYQLDVEFWRKGC